MAGQKHMKLLLTSAGLIPEIAPYFLDLLGKKPEESKMVFIPTAANPELDRWYLNKDKLKIAQLGIIDINEVDIEKETQQSLAGKLKDADIIFVEGGNTFYLMSISLILNRISSIQKLDSIICSISWRKKFYMKMLRNTKPKFKNYFSKTMKKRYLFAEASLNVKFPGFTTIPVASPV